MVLMSEKPDRDDVGIAAATCRACGARNCIIYKVRVMASSNGRCVEGTVRKAALEVVAMGQVRGACTDVQVDVVLIHLSDTGCRVMWELRAHSGTE